MLRVFLLAHNEVYLAYEYMKYPYVVRCVANIQTTKIRRERIRKKNRWEFPVFNTDVIRCTQKKCFPLLTFPSERREFVTKELSGFQNQYELWYHLLRLQPAHTARHCTQLRKDVSSLHERAGLTHTQFHPHRPHPGASSFLLLELLGWRTFCCGTT